MAKMKPLVIHFFIVEFGKITDRLKDTASESPCSVGEEHLQRLKEMPLNPSVKFPRPYCLS